MESYISDHNKSQIDVQQADLYERICSLNAAANIPNRRIGQELILCEQNSLQRIAYLQKLILERKPEANIAGFDEVELRRYLAQLIQPEPKEPDNHSDQGENKPHSKKTKTSKAKAQLATAKTSKTFQFGSQGKQTATKRNATESSLLADEIKTWPLTHLITFNTPWPYGKVERERYDRHHNCAKLFHQASILIKRILTCGGRYPDWQRQDSNMFGFMEHYDKNNEVTFPHIHVGFVLNKIQIEWLRANRNEIVETWQKIWSQPADHQLIDIRKVGQTRRDRRQVASYITKQAHLCGSGDVIAGDENFVEKYRSNQSAIYKVNVTAKSLSGGDWILTKAGLPQAVRYRDEHYGKKSETMTKNLAGREARQKILDQGSDDAKGLLIELTKGANLRELIKKAQKMREEGGFGA